MVADFRRVMSMQHWPDEVRKLVGGRFPSGWTGATHAAEPPETLVEVARFEDIEPFRPEWLDLARRAIEPNPFMHPDFALTAMVSLPAAQRPEVALVWQRIGGDPRARLIGLWGLEPRRSALFGGPGRAWRFRHSALGAPLIDRLAATRSVDAFLSWLPERRPARSALVIPALTRDGAVFQLLVDRCRVRNLSWTPLEAYERAALKPGRAASDSFSVARSSKHRREVDRLARRLADIGAVEFCSASSPEAIRSATEWFLALEQLGWKGARGTAFMTDVGDTAFLRTAMRLLARSGRCRIDWLALDGRPIAMAIMLMAGARTYFWKTAYDENYARYSPGVQLARRLLERQLADPSVELTDSCAIANHPMIDRVWPDRLAMLDMMIAVEPARARAFEITVRQERLRRTARAALKSAANTALRRRVS